MKLRLWKVDVVSRGRPFTRAGTHRSPPRRAAIPAIVKFTFAIWKVIEVGAPGRPIVLGFSLSIDASPCGLLVNFATDIAITDILGLCVLGLESNAGVVRCFFFFLSPLAELRRVSEAENLPSKLCEWAINLILGALHRKEIYQVQRCSIELLEHLMTIAPLGKEPLADLPKYLDAIPGTDLRPPKRLSQFGTDVRVVQLFLGRLDNHAAPAEIDQHVDHLVLVFQVVSATKVDVDIVRLVESPGSHESCLLGCEHEGPTRLTESDKLSELGLHYRS